MYRARALKPSQTPGRALGRVKSLAGWYIPSYTSERPRLPWLRSHDLRLVVTDISELRSVCAAHSAVWAWAVCLFNILSSSFSGIVVALVAMTTVLYKPWVHGGQMWPLFSYILIVFNVTFFYFLYHFFTFATCNAIQKLWNVVSFSNSLMFWICWSKKKKKNYELSLWGENADLDKSRECISCTQLTLQGKGFAFGAVGEVSRSAGQDLPFCVQSYQKCR